MTKHRSRVAVLTAILALSACGSGTGPESPSRGGSIQVITATTGADLDLDGYLVQVGEDDPRLLLVQDTLPLNVDAGAYMVILSEIAPNCVADSSVRNVTVSDGSFTEVLFHLTCTELPPATVDVTGLWEGTYQGRDHVDGEDKTGEQYLELTQTGDDVTGKMWFVQTGSPDFPVAGRVSGDELELFVLGWTEPLISWQVRLTLRGLVSGSDMTGTASEQMGAWTGTWTATQAPLD